MRPRGPSSNFCGAAARRRGWPQRTELIRFLGALGNGKWVSNQLEHGLRETADPSRRATLREVTNAAERAVAETLRPLLSAAQAEYDAATAERREIIERGSL